MTNRTASIAINTAFASILAITLVACNQAPSQTGTEPPRISIGTEIDDGVVTSTVKAALLADATVKSADIKVETRKGEVLLSGFVDNQQQLDQTMMTVRTVAGVKSIQNNVALKGTASSIGNKVDASIITTQVKAALLNDSRIKSFDIAVVTRKDEVQLSGYVDNQGQMERAIEIARGIPGVTGVINEMSIKK